MGCIDIGALGLRGHGADFEREYGQSVDHGSGGFAAEPGAGGDGAGGVGALCAVGGDQAECEQEQFVHAFDGVVAGLVVAVDGAFVHGDGFKAGHAAAGQIFFVPEQGIVAVVFLHPVPDVVDFVAPCVGAGGHGGLQHLGLHVDDGGAFDGFHMGVFLLRGGRKWCWSGCGGMARAGGCFAGGHCDGLGGRRLVGQPIWCKWLPVILRVPVLARRGAYRVWPVRGVCIV